MTTCFASTVYSQISRVWNYYAEMMHCIQIIALNVCFWGGTSTLLFFLCYNVCILCLLRRWNKKDCLVLSLSKST